MGAAALQKYIGSLGGIGASGVGSSSSYTPKELNKEVTPEKVSVSSSCEIADFIFHPIKLCLMCTFTYPLKSYIFLVNHFIHSKSMPALKIVFPVECEDI